MEPLKTLNGSKIWYSKFGIGKQMGSKVYLHKRYALSVTMATVYWKAKRILEECDPEITFNCICYDIKQPLIIRFDTCPGFDIEREPVVGWQYTVDTYNRSIKKKYCPQIFHHKWTFCKDDYTGFNVKESYEWSKTWLKYITSPSGYLHKWNEELKTQGLPVDNV